MSEKEALAEFDDQMEWYVPKNTKYEPYWRRGGMEVKEKNMKYDTSFDWLIPLLEKIESQGGRVVIDNNKVRIHASGKVFKSHTISKLGSIYLCLLYYLDHRITSFKKS